QLTHQLLDPRCLQGIAHAVDVEAYRVCAELDLAGAGIQRRGHAFQAHGATVGDEAWRAALPFQGLEREHATGDVDEVLHLTRDMETDVVALQQAADDLSPPGQNVEYVGRGE